MFEQFVEVHGDHDQARPAGGQLGELDDRGAEGPPVGDSIRVQLGEQTDRFGHRHVAVCRFDSGHAETDEQSTDSQVGDGS